VGAKVNREMSICGAFPQIQKAMEIISYKVFVNRGEIQSHVWSSV